MTQASPTVLVYGQAILLINEFNKAYSNGDLQNIDQVSEKLRDILSQYARGAGTPMAQFEPIVETEPPLSAKMNRFWDGVQKDTGLLQHQMDILRAATIFTHNNISTEIEKAAQDTAVVSNKLKTLQLYTGSVDPSIVTFGDYFKNDDFIDLDKTPVDERASIVGDHFLSLGQLGDLKNLAAKATVTILDASNGVAGNNHEINDPNTALTDPATKEKIYVFKAETNAAQSPKKILDGNPDSWFEYEACLITPADRAKAKNLNFEYITNISGGTWDWAKGPPGNVLKLFLQYDLGSRQKLNLIQYTPFGLENNANFPVLVKQVLISDDATNWNKVYPENVWVGTEPNLQEARAGANVKTRDIVWMFEEQFARYVRFDLEQPNALTRNLGHVYWVDSTTKVRVKGPNPPYLDPTKYYRAGYRLVGKQLQKREFFSGKRWVIGIKDLVVQQVQFRETSTIVSKPIRPGGLVDRVVLEADIYIPPEFDPEGDWVQFFISPDSGSSWLPISRIQDDFEGTPEILSFNDPTPVAFREPGVRYYDLKNPVDDILVKIVLSRPTDQKASSPLVRSYKVKVKKR